MERGEYFRVDPGSNRLDNRSAEEETSCCGVNLAFAVFGVEALGLRPFSRTPGSCAFQGCPFFRTRSNHSQNGAG
jgi:hypothetical protein